MTTRKSFKSNFAMSAIALGVAMALRTTSAWSQTTPSVFGYEEDDPIQNPTSGAMEIVKEVILNPYGLVLTYDGHYLWAGPTAKDDTFIVPATPEILPHPAVPATPDRPESPAEPGRPAQPERTYVINEVLLGPDPTPNNNQVDPGPPIGIKISCTSGCDPSTPPADMPFVVVPPPGTFPPGYFGASGQPARDVPTGDLTLNGNQNRLAPRKEGAWGDNGDDGWGIEICIFSCWTLGDPADNGQAGVAGEDNPVNVTTTNNGPNNGAIVSTTFEGPGIWATSRGGNGGEGGDAWGALPAGSGGAAGAGGDVTVTSNVNISTSGVRGYGIWAQSQAGFGGKGGNGYIFSSSGNGGPAAEAGDSIATNNGDGVTNGRIITTGDNAIGIYVQSIGGGGGDAGSSYGVVGDYGSSAFGGNAHNATAINNAYVATSGVAAHGVVAQSVGGKGGNGGDVSNLTGIGGGASGGGDGATAVATNSGTIITQGLASIGLYAQSVGGGGGDGGNGGGITSVGGNGGAGGNGKSATATNAAGGDVFTTGSMSYGILAQSIGGGGGNGGSSAGVSAIGGGGTSGGQGDHATANNYGSIETGGTYATAMVVQSIGGGGGAGGQAGGIVAIGGSSQANLYGADPNNGGEVDANNFANAAILTGNRAAHGILAQSIGGGGGTGGGANGVVGVGGSGGTGGNGWLVDVLNQGSIQTRGEDAKGILAQSIGGGGGSAGNAGGVVGIGGSGAGGGNGYNVTVTNDTAGVISTRQRGADGVLAQSIGGGGGNGGSSTGVSTIGGSGSTGGEGGTVTVINRGSIYTGLDVITPGLSDTAGAWARGILAQSIGGGGGTGGDAGGAIGGTGGNGGAGSKSNTVTVSNSGLIATRGNLSSAIEAQSIGGGGGSGGSGSAAFVSVGGNGGDGGAGGKVVISNDRGLTTLGDDSHGIFAQSIGGGGGNGGSSTTLTVFGGVGIGGAGGKGGAAETVTINANPNAVPTPTIRTQGDRAKGILAQSVGGGGGNGGFAAVVGGGYIAAASASVGGKGGDGGNSNLVQINGDTSILTEGADADGIVAQSIGGSGGNGGFALSFAFAPGDVAAAAFSASVGGRGGGGGDGNVVRLRSGGDILTTGNLSDGIVAQSIGGGGGNGGFAVAISATAAAGANAGVSTSVGGDGGAGGKADLVDAQYDGSIATEGDDSFGMVLQSVGGGGGNGGFTVSGAVVGSGGASAGVAVGVGGAGGSGGAGGKVLATIDGDITTGGDRSTGLVAQSIGGRGGNGGFNISGAITGSGGGAGSVAVGVGGAGAGGGAAETVDVTLNGGAITGGDDADAVVVQSIGGGGGNGGMNVSGALSGSGGAAGSVAIGVGGEAGAASNGNVVHVTVNGNIDTSGRGSNALVAQSIGGSGGNGGMNVSGQITGSGGGGGGVAVGIGGGGGAGGDGLAVTATLNGDAVTRGDNATAVIAQSLGGGGGNGGMTASGGIVATGGAGGGVAVGVGGSGGGAGNSALTTLRITGNVDTVGRNSGGVLAQSLGGGGGNGGMAVVGQLTASGAGAGGVAVGVGGSGGSGGTGGAVDARIEGNVHTRGAQSMGVVAQSLGGGGGNGGLAVSGVLTASGSTGGAVAVGVGGSGGDGGAAARVDADLIGDVITERENSTGFLAQSLGGGGGNGGMSVSAALTASGANAGAVAVGIGGSGGAGGDGNVVDASFTGSTVTLGANSAGVVAQSLGGGGGNGGMNVSAALAAGGSASGSVAVGVGGAGGVGGHGFDVVSSVVGEVDTFGENSAGVIAQSLGGGGGNGGLNVTGTVTAAGSNGGAVAVGVGGSGGGGGGAGVVDATLDGAARTRGDNSAGFIAQSIGGGGGNGALNATAALTASGSSGGSVAVGVGGGGGGAGDGGAVTATVLEGSIATAGSNSHGVLAQSVGGGGGNGGMNVAGAIAGSAANAGAVAVGVGGSAGGGGSAAKVTGDITADVLTTGNDSLGVLLQSVGGGGGNGAMNISGALGLANGGAAALSVGVGGRGGVAGNGLDVDATVNGNVTTTGSRSIGVLAQSVGGGGGNGGTNVSAALTLTKETGGAMSVGVGGFGGAGGDADIVGLARTGVTRTTGANSHGVIAQSIGGGGGNGGMNVSGALAISGKGTAVAASLGLGGFGGGGGDAKAVTAAVTGDVLATGYGALSYGLDDDGNYRRSISDGSYGVLAQSVGGSGGNGGMNISAGIALDASNNGSSHSLTLGVGGFGGSGGNAGAVTLDVTAGVVRSVGDERFGVGAQSVGGGGGNGGMNISGGIAMDGVITAGIGGFGGDGGTAGAVNASATTDISAVGANAIGFFAQSLGGGGGNGGINISGGIQGSSETSKPTLVFGLGGFGGAGNLSSTVDATQRGNVVVQGRNSIGVLAQSVAGGGGAGALNVSGNLARGKGYNASIGVGGSAGSGADSARVLLISDGNVSVDGREAPEAGDDLTPEQIAALGFREHASGVLVQSIGGGGGTGGVNLTGLIAPMGNTLTAGIGGSGGGGGDGGEVYVRRGQLAAGIIQTFGDHAGGLIAQSIGGGGGNAGMNMMFTKGDDDGRAINIGVGGSGGSPGHGKLVDVQHSGDIRTQGNRSFGLLAQSVGGGGGNADYNLSDNESEATALNLAIGGDTGPGGDGGEVLVNHAGNISTTGNTSIAIFAQSVGGGGGSAGTDFVASDAKKGLSIQMGRAGGTGGDGNHVRVDSDGILFTQGDRAVGIFAQSVGKGGGESSSNSIEVTHEGKEKGSDKAASLEVGIEGGSGGIAHDVDVFAHGAIYTLGQDAHGIFAQSVGGGGGSGGSIERQPAAMASTQIQVGVGGSGGSGGISGAIQVDSDADIETAGDKSHGIFAQSVGGGGGTGGYTATVDLEPDSEGPTSQTLAVSVGGDGGTASTSSTVDVVNRGLILTHGNESHGINAESTGGGGGAGGAVLSVGSSADDTSRSLSVNVGGTGGDGGVSDKVTVLNQGSIETGGDNSIGIRARSIGGKGGDGGLVLNLGLVRVGPNQSATRLTVNVGGDGAIGGISGDVEVTNRAQAGVPDTGVIVTHGHESHGIFAQSIGGGGGNGSSVITSNLGTSMSGQVTVVDLAFGGKGGQGSIAGDVTVTNDSVIDTEGEQAHGIFAQSIGGGGGNGGLALAANAILAAGDPATEGLLTLGGAGGSGDDAGDVIVNNSGRIITRGERSHGILAQSIGGGGGNAGVGFGLSTNPGTMAIAGVMSAVFGGSGGAGGRGGLVAVNHSGDITVLGDGSRAVVAESINGGGGEVVLDFNGVATLPGVPEEIYDGIPLPTGIEETSSLVFFGGGRNQGDSNAGNVTLNLTGTFGVAGKNGAANSVQAVGGGGGTYDLTLALHDTAGTADDVAIEGRLGGSSGTNNRGGDIGSTHDGDLVTEGDNTPGALVQSIGGGGGRANLDVSSQFGSLGETSVTLGGEDGNNEEGGDIEHRQSGATSTQGVAAHGGVFQSVGGGGGSLSLMVDGGTQSATEALRERRIYKSTQGAPAATAPKIILGSNGGALLKGGQVSLQLDGGVATQGDHAVGLVFQSVGAGGGVANLFGVDAVVTMGGAANAAGDGGDLAVTNTGDVVTEGRRAHGVMLQSLGGGGGAVFTSAAAANVTLSADNSGSGGNITFTQNGSIGTLGEHSYALFAQSVGGGGGYVDGAFAGSAGGAGGAGTIRLDLNGDVLALGAGSTGLFAQSIAANGLGGDITVALAADKQLVGGIDGVAVYFDGGAANRFTNYGSLMTRSGPSGMAFRGGAGGDYVDNFGGLMGNIDLGGGANGFANNIGAALYSGTLMNLGDPTNVFINNGLISPGAGQLAVQTQLFGSYAQSATGVADIEIDLERRVTDRLIATGTVSVAGRIDLSLMNTHTIRSGTTWQPLFNGAGGVTNAGVALQAPQSLVINYNLYRYPTELGVAYDVDFAAHGRVSGNRVAMGEYLNRVTQNGGTTGVGDVIAMAVVQTDVDVYASMLTQLDTEFYAEQQAIALNGAQRFARNLQNCGTLSIGESVGDENGCVWARYDDNPSSREAEGGFPAAESNGSSISAGLQKPTDNGWTLGVAIDVADSSSRGFDDLWTANSKFMQLGGSVRRDFGPGSFGATLQLGNNSQDVTRVIGVTNVYEARGSRDVHFITNVLDYTWDFEPGWNLEAGSFSFQPSVNLGSSLLSYGSMTEHGAGGQSAVIDGGDESHLWIEPAIGARYTASFGSGATLRTFLRAGLLQYFSGTSTGVEAGLEGAPADAQFMRIGSDLDRTHVVGEAGLQYQVPGGFTLGLSYTHQDSDIREGGSGSLRFALPLK